MDHGLAVSRKGYDVKNCPDRQLAFSSAFPTLKIFGRYSVTGTVPSSGVNTITITHNLGFYAPFVVFNNGSGNNVSSFMTAIPHKSDSWGTVIETFFDRCRQYQNSLQIDIWAGFGGYTAGTTVYLTVFIGYDDFRTVSALTINEDASSGSSAQDYGFRCSKDGYDVKTCTDDQLSFSSSFSSQKIHQKGSATGGVVYVEHNLPYVPPFYAYKKHDSWNYIKMMSFNAIGGRQQVEGDICYITETYDDWGTPVPGKLRMAVQYTYWVPLPIEESPTGGYMATGNLTGYTFYHIIFKEKING